MKNTLLLPNGSPKPATISDVARAAGVAKTTVSYALSGKGQISPQTRELVLQTAKELGFEPNLHAQRLSNGRCKTTVGLFSLYLDMGVGAQKIRAIQGLLLRRGYHMPIHTCGYYQEDAELQVSMLAELRRTRPVAIICNTMGLSAGALAELRRHQAEGGVLVCYDYPLDLDCDQVIFDREDNTYQAARHLLELGHRRLGHATHNSLQSGDARTRGFARALKEFGLSLEDAWAFGADQPLDYEAGGRAIAQRFLSLPQGERPTGVCIVNDYAALAFMAEVSSAGLRVPEDVSVVGHDDLFLANSFSPPLTTSAHPTQALAEKIVELLCSRLDGASTLPPRRITVCGELKVRQSTCPPID